VEVSYKRDNLSFELLGGELKRAISPTNHTPGVFRREVYGGRLSYLFPLRDLWVSINYINCYDDLGSIGDAEGLIAYKNTCESLEAKAPLFLKTMLFLEISRCRFGQRGETTSPGWAYKVKTETVWGDFFLDLHFAKVDESFESLANTQFKNNYLNYGLESYSRLFDTNITCKLDLDQTRDLLGEGLLRSVVGELQLSRFFGSFMATGGYRYDLRKSNEKPEPLRHTLSQSARLALTWRATEALSLRSNSYIASFRDKTSVGQLNDTDFLSSVLAIRAWLGKYMTSLSGGVKVNRNLTAGVDKRYYIWEAGVSRSLLSGGRVRLSLQTNGAVGEGVDLRTRRLSCRLSGEWDITRRSRLLFSIIGIDYQDRRSEANSYAEGVLELKYRLDF
jgi:hypothetical protein